MDAVTLVLLIAALGTAFWLFRSSRARQVPGAAHAADYPSPKPLKESFQVEGWDGFTGMQMALAVELSDDRAFPLIEAGTIPPVSRTQTFSTARADQSRLTLTLRAGLTEEVGRLKLAQRISFGPIAQTGEAIRQIEVTFVVDELGTISVSARMEADGAPVGCTVVESQLEAIPVGRR